MAAIGLIAVAAGSLDVTGVMSASDGSAVANAVTIPLCRDITRATAPSDWYRDRPVYVYNEQPLGKVRRWAKTKPGFEGIWIDRGNLGWISLAFSVDAEKRQAQLEKRFPDAGAVVVPVDWTQAELRKLRKRVGDELETLPSWRSLGSPIDKGVVAIGVSVLTDEVRAAYAERFAGVRVCIDGPGPESAIPAGPQPAAGDGWRLLADEIDVGVPYRTDIATDASTYERLWDDVGLSGDPPPVDFESEVVVWFGAVYGGSCPELRLDDVVVQRERAVVHADIVLVGLPRACTLDARSHAYVVALDRAELPSGSFAIQLGDRDPPSGARRERTVVDVDLSRPGTVAQPAQIRSDRSRPAPDIGRSRTNVEPGKRTLYRLDARCGVEWLGRVNGPAWTAEVPQGQTRWIPWEWRQGLEEDGSVVVTITLQGEPDPRIKTTSNGYSLTYRPTRDVPPDCG